MSTDKSPRIIYRNKGYPPGYHLAAHGFSCRRDAESAYPPINEWKAEYLRQIKLNMERLEEGLDDLRELMREVDYDISLRAAEQEEWWQWLIKEKEEHFPDADFQIYGGEADSDYTHLAIDDDNLAMMFKQAFQGT